MNVPPLALHLRRSVALALTLLTVTACGGSDDGGPTEPDPTPTVSITASPSSLEIQQGDDAEVTVTVTRGGGFTGAVTIAAQGLPNGVTAPAVTVPSGSTSSTVTFTASASAPATASAPGSAGDEVSSAVDDGPAAQAPVSVTLRATASGVSAATTSLSLTVTEAPTGSFSVALDPASLSVQQGASSTVDVTVSRTAPFTGAVSLSASGAPDDVSVTFDPAQVDGTESTMQVGVAEGVAPGEYTLTVTGSGDGPDDASAQLTLTVTEAASGSFSLSVASGTLSLQQGNGGSVGVTVTRVDPFTGPVSLSLSGAPSGATVSVDPAEVAGTSATVDVTLANDATVGDHTITLTGTGDGVAQQTASFTLTITARPAGTDYSWSFCPDVPDWFAVKDGDAAWQAISPTGDTFDFNAASDRVGIAWVLDVGGDPELTVQFLGSDEVAAVGARRCTGRKTVNGTTVGIGPLDNATVSMGGATASVIGAAGTTFTLENVRDGEVDLFASKTSIDIGTGQSTLERLYLARDLTPADGSSVSVDFTGANSFAPGSANLTVNGLDGDQAIVNVSYTTAGASGSLFNQVMPSAASSRTFPTVPASRQESDDLHGLTVTTVPAGATGFGDFRSFSYFFRDPTDRTVPLGPDLGATDLFTDVTAPYLRPRVTYAPQAEYDRYFLVNYSQDTADRSVSLVVTDDYLDGGAIDLIVPDFSGTAGWNDAWALVATETITYIFTASGWSGSGDLTPDSFAGGAEITTAFRIGEIDP